MQQQQNKRLSDLEILAQLFKSFRRGDNLQLGRAVQQVAKMKPLQRRKR